MSKRQGPEGAARRTTPEDMARRTDIESDTEGHARRADAIEVIRPTDEPGAGPEGARRAAGEGEDDVEGHNFGHNAMLSRSAAQTREREVQRNLKQHDLKGEARRPFLKRGS